jgi:hypothetical protein
MFKRFVGMRRSVALRTLFVVLLGLATIGLGLRMRRREPAH